MLPASSKPRVDPLLEQVQSAGASALPRHLRAASADSRTSSAPRSGSARGSTTCSSSACNAACRRSKFSLPADREAFQPVRLRHPERGLHVGELEVVADVREDVLVVVAGRQRAEAAVEAAAADAVEAGRAPAVAAPLAQRADRARPRRRPWCRPRPPPPSSCGARDRTSRSPRRRTCPSVRPPMREPSASQQSSISTRSCSRQSASRPGRVVRVAEAVGGEDAARARADRVRERLERRVVGVGLDVDVDRPQAVLVERRDGGREADRGRDHLVAGCERALVQVRAAAATASRFGLRARADERDVRALGDLRQAGAELDRRSGPRSASRRARRRRACAARARR